MTDVPSPAPEDAKMIASALRQLDWSGASIGHKMIVLAAAEALEKLPMPPVAPAGDREAVARARRAIEALRKPDAAFARVPNTVRQATAEVIESLLGDAHG